LPEQIKIDIISNSFCPSWSFRIEKIFGPCFSGLDVVNTSALSTPYPCAITVGDDGLKGVDGTVLPRPGRPLTFAHGISHALTSDNFLFDFYRSDFRKENKDFDVPVPVDDEPEIEEAPHSHTEDDARVESISEEPDASTAADRQKGEELKKSVAKTEQKKPPAKGGAAKGGAAKGGAAKGGASKGKVSTVKKKR
jgi:hypothetical protein